MNGRLGFKVMNGLLQTAILGSLLLTSVRAAEPIRVLIVDGQNNHNWKATTPHPEGFPAEKWAIYR